MHDITNLPFQTILDFSESKLAIITELKHNNWDTELYHLLHVEQMLWLQSTTMS